MADNLRELPEYIASPRKPRRDNPALPSRRFVMMADDGGETAAEGLRRLPQRAFADHPCCRLHDG